MRPILNALIVLLFASAAACGGPAGIPTPEERKPLAIRQGASDLACAEGDLSARYLGERLFAVAGCGKRATYRVICKLTVYSCYLIRIDEHE